MEVADQELAIKEVDQVENLQVDLKETLQQVLIKVHRRLKVFT